MIPSTIRSVRLILLAGYCYVKSKPQCINSISRPVLNQRLLEALPEGITIRFLTKLSHIDFGHRVAYGVRKNEVKTEFPGREHDDGRVGGGVREEGKRRGKEKDETLEDEEGTAFDLVIGCDGSWSKVRSEMMRVVR